VNSPERFGWRAGDVDGLDPKWKRGPGRWVRDVVEWSMAPLMFRNELIPVDSLSGERQARGPAKASGSARSPSSSSSPPSGATVEVVSRAEDRDLVTGPMTVPS
jgi:hypothetical protein